MDTVWKEMSLPDGEPDETCNICVERRVWQKIGEKHMADNREPWGEWLKPCLVESFRALWPKGCATEQEKCVVEQVSRQVEMAARAALKVPLMLRYDYLCFSHLGDVEPSFRLVLPSGARLEVRHGKEGWSVRTCYFNHNLADRYTAPWLRFRNLAHDIRNRYAPAPENSKGPRFEIEERWKENNIERGFCFVNRESWGLDGKSPVPWDQLGAPWPPYPSAGQRPDWLRPPHSREGVPG